MRPIRLTAAGVLAAAHTTAARADIFQWEYIDPSMPELGRQESATLCPDGAGVDAAPLADLIGLDLTMAYLIGADLDEARLDAATLVDADLSGTDASRAEFDGADLTDATLTGLFCPYAEFTGADLTGADLTGARIERAIFGPTAILTNAQIESTASYQMANLEGVDFSFRDFSGFGFADVGLVRTSLEGAILDGADLSNAIVEGTNFNGSTLTRSQLESTASYAAGDLRGARLEGLDLPGVQAAGFILGGCELDGDFSGADFSQITAGTYPVSFGGLGDRRPASFRGSYTDADFSGATFSGGVTIRGDHTRADFTGADLGSGPDLTGAQLIEADFLGVSMSGGDLAARFTNTRFSRTEITGSTAFVLESAVLEWPDFRDSTLTTTEINRSQSPRAYIAPDGRMVGVLLTGETLRLWDLDPLGPFPPTGLSTTDFRVPAGATLRVVLEDAEWGSTIVYDTPGELMVYDGALLLEFDPDEVPDPSALVGTTFDLFDWPAGAVFSGTLDVGGDPGAVWDLGDLFTTGEATLIAYTPAPACPGDVDGDGATDVFDFADLAANFGAGPGATRGMGDLTGDGFVDVFDFADLAADFGCAP